MSAARKLLVLGGLVLAAFGMLYGLHYAIFAEHQALNGMGASLTEAFVQAARSGSAQWPGNSDLDRYLWTKYVYVRQVDVHSHWVGLAMLLIVMGAAFDRTGFSERIRTWIAVAMVVGAVAFPLGVLLQTSVAGPVPSALAIAGSALLTLALLLSAWGFAR